MGFFFTAPAKRPPIPPTRVRRIFASLGTLSSSVTSLYSSRSFSSLSSLSQLSVSSSEEEEEVVVTKPRFRYRVAAAFAPKVRLPVHAVAAGHGGLGPVDTFTYDPTEPARRMPARLVAGQDAFFITGTGNGMGKGGGEGGVAMAVADGVGGYAEAGIDSSDFSYTFCERMSAAAAAGGEGLRSPREVMSAGYEQVLDEDVIKGGASTACVGVATPDGKLEVANLGDSGYLILRHGKVHYASTPQTHAFNTPFQLAMVPKHILRMATRFGGGPFSDLPEDAAQSEHLLCAGDVVIFATDGVWDNLAAQEVLRVVCEVMVEHGGWSIGEGGFGPAERLGGTGDGGEASDASSIRSSISSSSSSSSSSFSSSLSYAHSTTSSVASNTRASSDSGDEEDPGIAGIATAVARAVMRRAKSASRNVKRDGPFAREVQRLFPSENFRGGKPDDICVVALVVVKERERG